MKKKVFTCLCLIIGFNMNAQEYWLRNFVNDFQGNHINLEIAEIYLDKALKEAKKSSDRAKRRIPDIAREYFRIGLINKGEKCKNYVSANTLQDYKNKRLVGLASSLKSEELKEEMKKANFNGKLIIAGRYIIDGKVDEAISVLTPLAKNATNKQTVKEILCERISDIKQIGTFYDKIQTHNHKPLYFELMNRIEKNEITVNDAIIILKDLYLFTDRSKELLAYASIDINNVKEALELIEQINDKTKREKAIIGLASRCTSEKIKNKICSLKSQEAQYECWMNQFTNSKNREITDDVVEKLKLYSNFLSDNDLVFFFLKNNEIDKALMVTNKIQSHNRYTQYEYIVKGYIENNQSKKAVELIEKLKSQSDLNEEIISKAIETALVINDKKLADQFYKKYLKTEDYKYSCLVHYVKYFMLKEDYKKLDEIISKNKYDYVRVSYYTDIAGFYIGKKWRHVE